jgi:D-methionine transport system ATP-binding protein
MITIKNLSKSYNQGTQTIVGLKDINLKIAKGKIFGVIGKSGAGKSTLLRCINGLETPTDGSVIINGVNVTQLSTKALRKEQRKIGMIFQQFNLLSSKTVYDNIALPLKLAGKSKNEIQALVEPLLQLTGLTDKTRSYPSQLSGGQKQRVAIARALANHPEVLLCDEATSALDPHTTKSILDLLQKVNQELGLTIVLITHEMNVIKDICDQVAVIDEGGIIENNNVLQIFTAPEHKVTKELISSTLKVDLPEVIKDNLRLNPTNNHYPLLQLTFVGKSTARPFLSEINEVFGVKCNILQANIELVHSQPIGFMLIQAVTDEQTLAKIISYAEKQSLQIEVLGYVD